MEGAGKAKMGVKKKKILIAAGGTGGHLFPAQNFAAQLKGWDVLFVGTGLARHTCFDPKRFAFKEVSSASFSFSKPLEALKGGAVVLKGMRESQAILRDFSPSAVVGFGSFVSLPPLLAAKQAKIPIVLHEQNAIPGKVNRLFSRFATKTAITFPASKKHLKGEVEHVAFPMRARSFTSKVECWEYFGLQPDRPLILVFGGSAGASQLNRLFLETAEELSHWQVVHITGSHDWAAKAQMRYEALNMRACVKVFEPLIDRAMEIADLAFTRSGAGTVSELLTFSLPALLVPYPFAAENHQMYNARYFVEDVGGGFVSLESTLDKRCVVELLQNLHQKRHQYKEAIRMFQKSVCLKPLHQLIEEMIL